MQVVQTDGEPPSSGSTIFANSGWTQKISSAFRHKSGGEENRHSSCFG